jgi:uncharacterized FlaG/YvyC family protein
MAVIYEIHKYQHDGFQYVVARTNKYSETKVRKDVERMNAMLNESLKQIGTRYTFAITDTSEPIKSKRTRKE